MTNNYILKRIRDIFKFNNTKIIEIFALADHAVTEQQVIALLKKYEDSKFEKCSDIQLSIFLNGWINYRRGKKEGPQPKPEKEINNNIILRKIKIALNLQSEDMIDILELAEFKIGKSELSSFFRREDHRQYRECQDQILRNFLNGMEIRYKIN
jgi:uncharacterized protein YehS (DUF1456 family)